MACASCSGAGVGQTAAETESTLREKAAAARAHGDPAQAINLYRQAVTADPQWLEGWWFLGNLQYSSDHYEEARASLDRYIALAPNAPAALALRGLSEFEVAAYAESLEDIQRALALGAANQPRNGQVLLYHEALLLTRLGRFEEAIAEYRQFVGRGIVNADIATGLGLAGLRVPALPNALPAGDLPLFAMAGEAAIKILQGDVETGRARFVTVLNTYPNTPFVHYFCGYLLFTRQPDDAVEEFRQELALSPSNALAHSMLAWAAEARGEYAAAVPDALAAVKSDPTLIMGQLVLGRALVETEDLEKALGYLNEVVHADPSNLEAHMSLAKAYSKLGRKQDARGERLMCLELSSKPGEGGPANANR